MACTPGLGGPSPTTTSTTISIGPTTTTIAAQDAAIGFRTCLEDLGVSIDPIPFDGNGRPRLNLVTSHLDFSDAEIANAVTVCSGALAAGALDFVVDELVRRAVVGRLESFSRCVRARGLEFPDPIVGFSGAGSPYPVADIPYSDPALSGAVAACRTAVLGDLPGLSEGP